MYSSCSAHSLKEILMTMGEHLTLDEVEAAYKGAPIDDEGNLDYCGYVRLIKHGSKDEDLVKAEEI